jgi:hypothetical protein
MATRIDLATSGIGGHFDLLDLLRWFFNIIVSAQTLSSDTT